MVKVLTEDAAKKLLKGISIPPQPQIMVDLHLEMSMPDVSIDSITAIISKDAGISGSVLKVVNSPFFGLQQHITSISQALSLLGINNVINIVNSLSISTTLSNTAFVEMTRFWDNAVDVAMVAASIARMTGISAPDEAYSLGLFHNCGIPLLMGRFKHYPEILQKAYHHDSAHRLTDFENEVLDCNHAVVGYYVARAWKLPEYINEAIADHHKTAQIFLDLVQCDKKKKNLLATLKLSETICKTHKTLGNADYDYEFKDIKNSLLIYLGLSEYDFEDLRAAIMDMGIMQG